MKKQNRNKIQIAGNQKGVQAEGPIQEIHNKEKSKKSAITNIDQNRYDNSKNKLRRNVQQERK